MHKIFLPLILILTCCASSPSLIFRPAASKDDYGYWEKVLSEKGAYEVHANLPANSEKKFQYLALHLGELCQKKGLNNFDPVGYVEKEGGLSLDSNPQHLEKFYMLGFCYARNVRRALGVPLVVRGEYVSVETAGASKELQRGDIILHVGKKEVSTKLDVQLAIFELPDTQTKVELKILREGKELTLDASLHESSDEIYNVQDLYSLQRDLQ